MIVALDGGLDHLVPGVHPQMVVSGVNLGPNLSQDSYHSGTMGAAERPVCTACLPWPHRSRPLTPKGWKKPLKPPSRWLNERPVRFRYVRVIWAGQMVNLTPVISAPGQRQKLMIGGSRTLNPLCLRPSQMVI